MPEPCIGEGCLCPTWIEWGEEESKDIQKRILALSDEKIKKIFEIAGMRFFRDEKGEEIPLFEVIAEIRREGIGSGKLVCLLNEGFLDYHVDGTELIKLVEKIEKES